MLRVSDSDRMKNTHVEGDKNNRDFGSPQQTNNNKTIINSMGGGLFNSATPLNFTSSRLGNLPSPTINKRSLVDPIQVREQEMLLEIKRESMQIPPGWIE